MSSAYYMTFESEDSYNRHISKVERAAAARALEEAAENFQYCKDYGYRATRALATENYLRARAAEIRERKSE